MIGLQVSESSMSSTTQNAVLFDRRFESASTHLLQASEEAIDCFLRDDLLWYPSCRICPKDHLSFLVDHAS